MSTEPRLTVQTLRILRVMLEEPEADWFGLQLSRDAGLKPGTIYPTLARLEESGWLERRKEDIDPHAEGRPARALYRFTSSGSALAHRALEEHVRGLAPPPSQPSQAA